jgi:hypothetical protein
MGIRVHRETEGTERVWEEDRKGLVGYGSNGCIEQKRGRRWFERKTGMDMGKNGRIGD